MLALLTSAALHGIEAEAVQVEVNANEQGDPRLVLVGLPADNTMRLPIFETVLQGITVVGSLVGTRADLTETFELHADGRTRIVRETRQLEDVNASIADVLGGSVEARVVFDLR